MRSDTAGTRAASEGSPCRPRGAVTFTPHPAVLQATHRARPRVGASRGTGARQGFPGPRTGRWTRRGGQVPAPARRESADALRSGRALLRHRRTPGQWTPPGAKSPRREKDKRSRREPGRARYLPGGCTTASTSRAASAPPYPGAGGRRPAGLGRRRLTCRRPGDRGQPAGSVAGSSSLTDNEGQLVTVPCRFPPGCPSRGSPGPGQTSQRPAPREGSGGGGSGSPPAFPAGRPGRSPGNRCRKGPPPRVRPAPRRQRACAGGEARCHWPAPRCGRGPGGPASSPSCPRGHVGEGKVKLHSLA